MSALINIINEAIFTGLLLFGGYLVLANIRTMLLPQKVGTLIAFEGGSISAALTQAECKNCKTCSLAEQVDGKLSFPVKIKLRDDTITTAEISPCSLCIDKLKIGDRVGITKVGSRIIVQKISKLTNMIVT